MKHLFALFVTLLICGGVLSADTASDRVAAARENGDSDALYRAESYIAPLYCYDLNPWHGVTFEKMVNGRVVNPTYTFTYQDMGHLKVRQLYERAGIAGMEAAAETELDLIQAISDWANEQWGHMQPMPYPTWDAHEILDRVETGDAFWCTFKAALFVQACNAAGLTGRMIGISRKHSDAHTVSEVYSNQFRKWMLVDPWINCYFERDGIPLSAREFHDAIADPSGIYIVFGKNGQGTEFWDKKTGKADSLPSAEKRVLVSEHPRKGLIDFYHDVRIVLRNDQTVHPQEAENRYVDGFMLPYNARGGEFWGPQLHWTDDSTAPIITSANTSVVNDFEWPLNEVTVDFMKQSINGAPVEIELTFRTLTPSFSHYRLIVDGEESETRSGNFLWRLKKGRNTLSVCSLNAAGREGFTSEFVLDYDPSLFDYSRQLTVTVPNPGFEKAAEKADGKTMKPDGWRSICSNALREGEFCLDSKVKHAGKYSLKAAPSNLDGIDYAFIARSDVFEVNAASDVVYTVWLRADKDGTPADICLLDSTPKGQSSYVKRVKVGKKWAKYTLPCRINNEMTKAYVGFKVYSGTVWADDISVVEAGKR